jgi:hypothetical protein
MPKPVLNATARAIALRARLTNSSLPLPTDGSAPLTPDEQMEALVEATQRAEQLRARLTEQTKTPGDGGVIKTPETSLGALLSATERAERLRARLANQVADGDAQLAASLLEAGPKPTGSEVLRQWMQNSGLEATMTDLTSRVSTRVSFIYLHTRDGRQQTSQLLWPPPCNLLWRYIPASHFVNQPPPRSLHHSPFPPPQVAAPLGTLTRVTTSLTSSLTTRQGWSDLYHHLVEPKPRTTYTGVAAAAAEGEAAAAGPGRRRKGSVAAASIPLPVTGNETAAAGDQTAAAGEEAVEVVGELDVTNDLVL